MYLVQPLPLISQQLLCHQLFCSPEIESLNQPICPETLGSISFINLPTPGVWTIIADPIATYTGSDLPGLFENLSPGSYTFAIDWNGCTSEFSTESAVIETPQTQRLLLRAMI